MSFDGLRPITKLNADNAEHYGGVVVKYIRQHDDFASRGRDYLAVLSEQDAYWFARDAGYYGLKALDYLEGK